MEMKLLKDAVVSLYAIKVDYFVHDPEADDEIGVKPMYLTIDTETKTTYGVPVNLITFEPEITDNTRVFDKRKEAVAYMNSRANNPCCYKNARVIKITYCFGEKKWREE